MAIILPGGFNITNNEPVDARLSLADETTRYALSSANVYEGLIVFQQDNNTIWVLTDTLNVGNSNGWTQIQLGSVDSNLPSGVVSGSDQVLGGTGILSSSNQNFTDFSSSVDDRLDNIEGFTSSIDSTIKTKLNVENVVSSSQQISTYGVFAELGGDNLVSSSEQISGYNVFLEINGDNVVSSSAQVKSLLPSGTVSGSIQVSYPDLSNIPAGIVSGSAQVISLLPSGTVSGSSQVSYLGLSNIPSGIVSGAVQIKDLGFVDLTSDQTISGTKTFNDIVVNGTGSFAYITSVDGTAKIIGDSYIILNNDTPTQRYAGIAVYDSGSVTPTTASLNFDGQTNDWFYEYSASTVDYGVVLFGPEYNTKGNPTYLTANRIPKAEGTHHLNDSNISDDGSTITLNSNVQVNGNISVTGNVDGIDLQLFSSSVDDRLDILEGETHENPLTFSDTTKIDFTRVGDTITATVIGGVVSGSGQLTDMTGDVTINSSGVSSITANSIVNADINTSAGIVYTKLNLNGSGIVSGSAGVTLAGDVTGTANANTVGKIQGIAITSGEATQLANIDTTTISATQWGYLGALNQGLTQTSTVQFGKVGVGGASDATYELKVTGDVGATGDVVAYVSSDRRLKNEIQPIETPLEKINAIGGYSFVWNEEKQNIYKGKDYGVIAQEIEQILPELVENRENGYKAVKYDRLVSLLIEGIKDLSSQVEELKQKINKGQ